MSHDAKFSKEERAPASRSLAILAILAMVVIALAAALIVFGKRGPQQILLVASVDEASRHELKAALTTYNEGQRRYSASLVQGDESQQFDLYLGPAKEGGIVWRSQGWRLWARLETLSGIEGDPKTPVIKPLREGRADGAGFESILSKLKARGIVPLILPALPARYSTALDRYLSRLGWDPRAKLAEWEAKGLLRRLPDLDTALAAIRKGEAGFLLGDDSLGALLSRSSDNHPEGFPLPGSATKPGGWVLGRADAFFLPDPAKSSTKAGALDLLAWLTSKGISRGFTSKLPGHYYYWSVAPAKGKSPVIDGPVEFLDPGAE
jgi:hypothetical protein